jgi:FAD/FMN-containing dehydrogenase
MASSLSRRKFIGTAAGAAAGAAAIGTTGWVPAFRVTAAGAAAPPNFPAGITLFQQAYKNWSGEIAVDGAWTCKPTTAAQIVTLANWARANNHKLRAKGKTHNWSPLTYPGNGVNPDGVVLVDTTGLTASTITAGTPATVTAETGITMETLLTRLEQSGYGLVACPAPGELTLGGVLAIGGHGTAIPANGETRAVGSTYGSLSNLITSVTAVVWDSATSQYALKTFPRSSTQCQALLTHVGRSFITSVTLQVRTNYRLRCQSWFDIGWQDLFAAPTSSASRKFANYVNSSGRVEAIWFPFTNTPWVKVWTVTPNKPLFSKSVSSPYNYPFADSLNAEQSSLVSQIIGGNPSLAPTFGNLQISVVGAGLITTGTWDIWGWSKNSLLYVRPTTLRVTANGYAVLTTRANIQRVVYEFAQMYNTKLNAYRSQGKYPMNGPVEIRVTGLDRNGDVDVANAGPPLLSAVRPRPDRPEWDVAVWLDILTIPGTPYANQFFREVEQWIYSNYSGTYAAVRAEWSKGWGYSTSAAWADPTFVGTTVPASFDAGQPAGTKYADARAALNTFDPHRIFTNSFLNTLLP